jgi:hypothetical protein
VQAFAAVTEAAAWSVIWGQCVQDGTEPMVKGEVSTGLTPLMAEPYRRFCQPCNAIHLYEMPFRLAALRAGLELQAGTSPPVFQPVRGCPGPARTVPDEFDVIRGGKTHPRRSFRMAAPAKIDSRPRRSELHHRCRNEVRPGHGLRIVQMAAILQCLT